MIESTGEFTNTIECSNCGNCQSVSSVDTSNTKQVFQGTDMSFGYWDVYSTLGLCRRCNQYGMLLKTEKRQSNIINEMYQSTEVQEMIKKLSKK